MKMAHLRHGRAGDQASASQWEHGGSYDAFAFVLFGGRRRQVFARLAALSGAGPGDQVLDLGCGTGYFTRVMAEVVTPGGTALGVDPSPEVIAKARYLSRATPCTFSEGTAEALDLADCCVDVVVNSLMIHHLVEASRPQAISEIFRVLRPGGRVLIADFRPAGGRIGRGLIGAVLGPGMGNNPVHLLEPMVRDAGFEHVRTGHVRPWMAYVQAVKPSEA